ncbi:MAG: tRNA pseudouridine(55) synthase TruB [Bacteroidales bacterium]|nr:tRNA pseudouridine(55) synthase TruB [Bacteroidales bacterium]
MTPFTHKIEDYPEGIILVIDKPYRWTSADVIRKIKYSAIRHFGKKNLKVGHAGTLDPLATGVLLVCIGNATKQAEELQRHDKEYLAGITFGAVTPSYDLEKEIDKRFPVDGVSEESVVQALKGFIGEQDQVAPLFSAKSVDGVRAYELARKAFKAGEPIPDDILRASRIVISECELVSYAPQAASEEDADVVEASAESSKASMRINVAADDLTLPHASVRVACTKGTYVRAFARDLGEALGTGAFLNSLRRTRSGIYSVADALTVEQALELLA